jgi:peptidoglycan/xylan/chitin deacetylase (PgdA/CDA1 family)
VAERRSIELRLDIDDDDELAELERALIRARATELSEVRRRQVRFTAGYGDATTREVLDDEGRRAQIRYDVLSRLLEAIRTARSAG